MGKRTRRREITQQAQHSRRNLIIGAIALGAVAVAALLIAISSGATDQIIVERPNPAGMSMGDPDAPVKVEEYSDFQCPYCGQFALEFEPDIVEKYIATGQVQFTYIPYSFIGPESVKAAEAGYCAADQNKFWAFHDVLFNNQAGENSGSFSNANLIRLAQRAGLSMAPFRECFDNLTYQEQVQKDFQGGSERGVTGTPSFYVNGEGPVDMRSLDAAIQTALDAAN